MSATSAGVLKKMIVETIEKNSDTPFYISLQHDNLSSTDFIITFIREVLPRAYEEALKEVSARKGVSFDGLGESKPLLLFYAVPRVFGAPAKVGNDRVSEKGARFQVRTTTRKHDTEEMMFIVENGLVVVDEKMDQSDVTGIQKMLSKEDKLAAEETCFVLGTGF